MDSIKSSQLKDQIRGVILKDFAGIMTTRESTTGKFILIAVGIEFLGACMDRQHIKATARSEKRFNSAIIKLFPKKYHHFIKKESVPNLYYDFRCPVIHRFMPGNSILLCSEQDSTADLKQHLSYNPEGFLILVAEHFYKDLAGAAIELMRIIDKK
jgi:hypothetical protein